MSYVPEPGPRIEQQAARVEERTPYALCRRADSLRWAMSSPHRGTPPSQRGAGARRALRARGTPPRRSVHRSASRRPDASLDRAGELGPVKWARYIPDAPSSAG